MEMRRSFGISLPVAAVIVVVIYTYFSTVFIFIDSWFSLTTSSGILNAVVFTVIAVLFVIHYTFAIVTNPGSVPPDFAPDVEDTSNPVHEIKRKDGDLRFCQKCGHYKPPRAHHCSMCKRCVLRMDHHCIWINNCVGHANHKAFFVSVFYGSVESIYALVLLVGSLSTDFDEDDQTKVGPSRTPYVISGMLLVPLSTALTVLLCWHIHLILKNKTTIEYHEGVRTIRLVEKTTGNHPRHLYDLGPYRNLTSVLGPNIVCWLFPTSSHLGSGLHFNTCMTVMEPYDSRRGPVRPLTVHHPFMGSAH